MSQEEFEEYINAGRLRVFDGVKVFKSVRRAIKRGLVSPDGIIYPKRPFHNGKSTRGRKLNEDRKDIYGRIKQRGI